MSDQTFDNIGLVVAMVIFFIVLPIGLMILAQGV